MQLYITGKHFKVVPRLREHLEEHLEKLNHYDPGIISAHVVVKTEKYFNIAEVTVKSSHFEFYGEGRADENMFAAVDLAIHRVEAQLKKHRERMKGTKKKYSSSPRRLSKLAPEVVTSEAYAPKAMSVDEASRELVSLEKDFLVYRDSVSKKLAVIYRREDGQHGVVKPQH